MKITISAYGKFDLFRWAEGFQKKKLLFRLLTDFYSEKSKLLSWRRQDREKIDLDKVKTFIFPRFLRLLKNWTADYQYCENYLFDWWASENLAGSDLVITRSSCALKTLKRAKKLDIKNILYRGSSHIEFQRDITREEYKIWNVPLTKEEITPKVINRELAEYELCDHFYTPSSFAAKTYLEKGLPASKIIHFPLSSEYLLSESDDLVPKKPKFQILYVGGISLRKGVQYLLEAVRNIRNVNPAKDLELILIGGISEEFRPFLKKYEGHFNYLGVIPHHEIMDYYKTASVFAFPSIDDGFGQVILEAMSFGLPVIATVNSGGPDVIESGKQGFIVPIRDPESISDKIVHLYENRRLTEEMGREAKTKVKEYSVEHFIQRWIDIFKELKWLK